MDRMLGRVRDANTLDEARAVAAEFLDGNGRTKTGDALLDNGMGGNGEGDQHIHLHMGGGNGGGGNGGGGSGGMMQRDEDPTMPGGGAGDEISQLLERVEALEEQMSQLMDGGEEDVELEEPDTQDRRRFKMRRGSKMTRDEEPPVPERMPEMVGETDLPGVEDLDKRMSTSDKLKKYRSMDSADMEGTWQEAVAMAEVIVPGIRIPTFDARLSADRTAQRLCTFRRTTLDKAMENPKVQAVISEFTGIKTRDAIRSLGCDSVKMAFGATATAMRANNNGAQFVREVRTNDGGNGGAAKPGAPVSLAEIQRRNKEAWKGGEFHTPS